MIVAGTSRARLGPAAALIDTSRQTVAACEENRLTRAVDTGTDNPAARDCGVAAQHRGRYRRNLSIDRRGRRHRRASRPCRVRVSRVRFDSAVVLVCDANQPRGWAAWEFQEPLTTGRQTRRRSCRATSANTRLPPAASQLTESLGFRAMRDEHLVEALARSRHDEAAATQQRLGEDLLRLIEGVRAQSTSRSLCLAGGLFFNTYFTTLAADLEFSSGPTCRRTRDGTVRR